MMRAQPSARPPAPPLMPPRAAPQRVADLVVRVCKECLNLYARKRCDQKYCAGKNCRRLANQREEQRRTESHRALMRFRDKEKGAFAAMTNIADRWRREDKAREAAYRAACLEKGVDE
jgi:hypothetical protein